MFRNAQAFHLTAFIYLSLLIFAGCSGSSAQVSKDFQSECWSVKDTVVLDFSNESTEQLRRISFPLTFTGEYSYSNIFMLFMLTTPSGEKSSQQFQFQLMDKSGAWNGDVSGDEVSFNMNLGDPAKFTEKGKYRIQILHNMRDSQLCGIKKAGISIVDE